MVLVGGLLVFLLIRTINKEEPVTTNDNNHIFNEQEMIEAMKNDNSAILQGNGGNIEILSNCGKVISEYLSAISSADYESAYNLYAIDLIEEKGYEYTLDSFTDNSEELRERMGVDGETTFLAAHYYSYIETENYILVSLILGSREGAVYSNPVSAEYTLIKVKDDYKILDFSYLDFDLYCMKFDSSENFGVLIPE